MRLQLENGATSTPYSLRINEQGEALTEAISRTELEQAVIEGNAYPPATGVVNLTDAAQSSVFYLKSDEEKDILISNISIIPTPSIGGSGNTEIDIFFDENSGTIIDNAVDAFIFNPNAKISTPFSGLAYQGVQGDISSGGRFVTRTTRDSQFNEQIQFNEIPFVLGRGNALSVKIKPATGNTSQNFIVFVIFRRLIRE